MVYHPTVSGLTNEGVEDLEAACDRPNEHSCRVKTLSEETGCNSAGDLNAIDICISKTRSIVISPQLFGNIKVGYYLNSVMSPVPVVMEDHLTGGAIIVLAWKRCRTGDASCHC